MAAFEAGDVQGAEALKRQYLSGIAQMQQQAQRAGANKRTPPKKRR